MNGKVARVLKKLVASSGHSYRGLKKQWHKLSQKDRAVIRRAANETD